MSINTKRLRYTREHLGGGCLIRINPTSGPAHKSEDPQPKDYKALRKLMEETNLILPSDNELFEAMHENPNIKDIIKGSGKFVYLRRSCDLAEGLYLIENGQLTGKPAVLEESDMERIVMVWKGHNPPTLFVLSDESAHKRKYRFVIDSVNNPSFATDILIGIAPVHTIATDAGAAYHGIPGYSIKLLDASIKEVNRIKQSGHASLEKTTALLNMLKRYS